jgi:hypothetical protein
MSGLPRRKLSLEDLRVESFVTTPQSQARDGSRARRWFVRADCTSQSCERAGPTCAAGCQDISCCFSNASCCTATCAT